MYRATGKRKTSVARVILSPGVGRVVINGREIDEYFGRKVLQTIALMPFETTHTTGKFDVQGAVSTAAASPVRPAPCVTASRAPSARPTRTCARRSSAPAS